MMKQHLIQKRIPLRMLCTFDFVGVEGRGQLPNSFMVDFQLIVEFSKKKYFFDNLLPAKQISLQNFR